jgi:protein SCO1/2
VTRHTRLALWAVLAALAGVVAVPAPALAGNDGVIPQHDQAKPKSLRPQAGIEEKIGAQLPMDLVFRDENDKPIALGDAVGGKPTILVPVYYRCPMLCTKVLTGVLEAVRQFPPSYSVGSEFNIVTVSMDPKEHGDLAREKKKAYLAEYGRPNAEGGWRFLTGTKEAIGGNHNKRPKIFGSDDRAPGLLDLVGYNFEYDDMMKEYNHPSAIIIVSPQGKVTRYFYGIGYDGEFEVGQESGAWAASQKPALTEAELRDRKAGREFTRPTTTLRLSLIEANGGHGGSLWDKFTLLCYRYDALHQGYSFNVLWAVRIGGIITLAAVVIGVLLALRREWRKNRAAAATAAQPNELQSQPAQGAGGTA